MPTIAAHYECANCSCCFSTSTFNPSEIMKQAGEPTKKIMNACVLSALKIHLNLSAYLHKCSERNHSTGICVHPS